MRYVQRVPSPSCPELCHYMPACEEKCYEEYKGQASACESLYFEPEEKEEAAGEKKGVLGVAAARGEGGGAAALKLPVT